MSPPNKKRKVEPLAHRAIRASYKTLALFLRPSEARTLYPLALKDTYSHTLSLMVDVALKTRNIRGIYLNLFHRKFLRPKTRVLRKLLAQGIKNDFVGLFRSFQKWFRFFPKTSFIELASKSGATEVVKYLLGKTAIRKSSILAAAAEYGSTEHFNAVRSMGFMLRADCFHAAAKKMSKVMILHLLLMDCPRDDSETSNVAVEYGDADFVSFLIGHGFLFPSSALTTAMLYNKTDIVFILLDAGVQPHASAIILALEHGNLAVFERFVRDGATIGSVFCGAACRGGNLEIIELFRQMEIRFSKELKKEYFYLDLP